MRVRFGRGRLWFTLSDSENTASAQDNTHIAQVNGTPARSLTINGLQDTVCAKRYGRTSSTRVTSGIERSAHENAKLIRTQRATVSGDMDLISIDKPTISTAELNVSDDMDMISIDKPTISAAELNVSNDMDMISIDKATISAAELNVSGDMDKISLNGPKISTAQGRISGEKN